jgi:hypothetical protein
LLSEVALEFMLDSMLPEILKKFNSSLKRVYRTGILRRNCSQIILAIVTRNLRKKEPKISSGTFLAELYHGNSIF